MKPSIALAALALALIGKLALRAPDAPAPPRAAYRYLPLAGAPLFDAAQTGTHCLALLPYLVTHDHWSIELLETEWTTLDGLLPRATIRIAQDGEVWLERPVSWEAGWRDVYLTAEELREIRRLDQRGCRQRGPTRDHARTFYVSYAGETDPAHAAEIPVDSDMGEVIDRIVRTANARYLAARTRQVRGLELDLRMPRGPQAYRVRVEEGVLTITRNGAELYRHRLAAEELVDLADWNQQPAYEGGNVSAYGWARGVLQVDFTHSLLFDSAELPLAFPRLGGELTRVIDADCKTRGCATGVSVSRGESRLVPP